MTRIQSYGSCCKYIDHYSQSLLVYFSHTCHVFVTFHVTFVLDVVLHLMLAWHSWHSTWLGEWHEYHTTGIWKSMSKPYHGWTHNESCMRLGDPNIWCPIWLWSALSSSKTHLHHKPFVCMYLFRVWFLHSALIILFTV